MFRCEQDGAEVREEEALPPLPPSTAAEAMHRRREAS
jgi:hypothetical protein